MPGARRSMVEPLDARIGATRHGIETLGRVRAYDERSPRLRCRDESSPPTVRRQAAVPCRYRRVHGSGGIVVGNGKAPPERAHLLPDLARARGGRGAALRARHARQHLGRSGECFEEGGATVADHVVESAFANLPHSRRGAWRANSGHSTYRGAPAQRRLIVGTSRRLTSLAPSTTECYPGFDGAGLEGGLE